MLVNNAGVLIARPFEELTLEDWDATMAINLRSLFLVTRAVLPAMRAPGRGTIVNVASLAGRNGFAGGTAYAASKHARARVQPLAHARGPQGDIRVVTVCPGSVDTGMLRDQPMLKSDPERILRPEDVAETILHALRLPARALVSEVDIRPTNPWTRSCRPASRSRCASVAACPFAELLPRGAGRRLGPGRADAGDRLRRRLRALSALPPPHAGDRRDHVPRAAVGRPR